jgi:hypothetical protein
MAVSGTRAGSFTGSPPACWAAAPEDESSHAQKTKKRFMSASYIVFG